MAPVQDGKYEARASTRPQAEKGERVSYVKARGAEGQHVVARGGRRMMG